MNDRIENTILNSLFFNEDFVRKAIPFIKPHFFSKRDERLLFIEDIFSNNNDIEVVPFKNLVTDLAREKSANIIVRGVRTVLDFDYEFKMAVMNKKLHEDIETVFFNSTENFSYISSSLVREIAVLGGDVSAFVPESVELVLKEKFLE